METRIAKALLGHSASRGGMNVAEIIDYLTGAKVPVQATMSRMELQMLLRSHVEGLKLVQVKVNTKQEKEREKEKTKQEREKEKTKQEREREMKTKQEQERERERRTKQEKERRAKQEQEREKERRTKQEHEREQERRRSKQEHERENKNPLDTAEQVARKTIERLSKRPFADYLSDKLQEQEQAAAAQRDEIESGLATALTYDLLLKESKYIPVSQLICANTRTDHKLVCPKLAAHIANAVIRVAAERIFADPEQSIMELPVNSLDAYNYSSTSIGKFGMGFYSMLYWLVKHSTRTLTITTATKGSSTVYVVTLQMIDGILQTRVVNVETEPEPTGYTEVTLSCDTDPLPLDNYLNLNNQLRRLKYIRNGLIYLNNSLINSSTKVAPEYGGNVIHITLKTNMVSVTDQAGGIPIDVIMRSLLVPSSSTKTIGAVSTSAPVRDTDLSSINVDKGQSKSSLSITVGDIVIVSIHGGPSREPINVRISMPPNTRLPVGRDDIIFTADGWESRIFFQRFMSLVEHCIALGDITKIMELLDIYVTKSNQQELYRIQSQIYHAIEQHSETIFVPKTNNAVWACLNKDYGIKTCLHPAPSLYNLENKLMRSLGSAMMPIFENILVLPVDAPFTYSNAGLSQIIFVSKSYMSNPNWTTYLMSSSKLSFKLKPASSSAVLAAPCLPSIQRLVTNYYEATFGGLAPENNVTRPKDLLDMLEGMALVCHVAGLNHQVTIDLGRHIAAKLSTIIFDFPYGTGIQGSAMIMDLPFYLNIRRNYTKVAEMDTVQQRNRQAMAELCKIPVIGTTVVELYHYIVDTWGEKATSNIYWFVTNGAIEIIPWNQMWSNYITHIAEHRINIAEAYVALLITNFFLPEELDPEYVLREIRQRATPHDLKMTIEYAFRGYVVYITALTRLLEDVKYACVIYANALLYDRVKVKVKVDVKPVVPVGSIIGTESSPYHFSSKSLVAYVFNNVIMPKSWLLDVTAFFQSRYNPNILNLQVVEIAVNEGTTKDYIPAVMTELVQNSLDAIRSNKNNLPTGKISVDVNDASITISDDVGIEYNRHDIFLAMLIPFLSTKSVSDPNVTGEMGSGFFYIYRQPWCKRVTIETIRTTVVTRIVATPVVNGDNRVTDIIYTVSQYQVPAQAQSAGTKITLELHTEDKKLLADAMVEATLFANTNIAYMNVAVSINGKTLPVYKSPNPVYTGKEGRVYLIDYNNPSLVMTNGVPYQLLSTFLEKIAQHEIIPRSSAIRGIMIDINKDYFKPVQSRNAINISDELYDFIYHGIHIALCEMIVEEKLPNPDIYLPHVSSRSHISQLSLPRTYQGNGMFGYLAYADGGNIAQAINEFIGILSRPRTKEYTKKDLDVMILTSKIEPYVKRIVLHWFSNKDISGNQAPPEIFVTKPGGKSTATASTRASDRSTATATATASTKVSDGSTAAAVSGAVAVAMPHTGLQRIVNAYWRLLLDLIDVNVLILPNRVRLQPPTILVSPDLKGYNGYYMAHNHSIAIKGDLDSIDTINLALDKLRDSVDVSLMDREPLVTHMSKRSIPSTLVHELLHAIRLEDHIGATHSNYSYIIEGNQVTQSFDQTAMEIYGVILRHGLILNL